MGTPVWREDRLGEAGLKATINGFPEVRAEVVEPQGMGKSDEPASVVRFRAEIAAGYEGFGGIQMILEFIGELDGEDASGEGIGQQGGILMAEGHLGVPFEFAVLADEAVDGFADLFPQEASVGCAGSAAAAPFEDMKEEDRMEQGGEDRVEVAGVVQDDAGGADEMTEEGDTLLAIQAVDEADGEVVGEAETGEFRLREPGVHGLKDQLGIGEGVTAHGKQRGYQSYFFWK